jgi:hypothetical protein
MSEYSPRATEQVIGTVMIASASQVLAKTRNDPNTGAVLAVSPDNLTSTASFVWKGARARKSTDQVAIGTGLVTVTWQLTDFDSGGCFAIGDPTKLTCTSGGTYLIIGGVNHSAVAGGYSPEALLQICVNGTMIAVTSSMQDSFGLAPSISTVYPMSQGGYVELKFQCNTNGNIYTSSHFEIWKLPS